MGLVDGRGFGPAVVGFSIFAIAVVVAALFLSFSSKLTEDFYSQFITNTTVSPANQSRIWNGTLTLDGERLLQSTLLVYNTSSLALVTSGNYSTTQGTGAGGTVQWTTTTFNGTNVTLDYDYLNTTIPVAASTVRNGTIGTANLSTYLPTLALIGAVIALIGLLVAAFVFGKRS